MTTEYLNNNPQTTLAATITDSVTSITVDSATGFPTGPIFRICIDSEIMIVTGVSGTTWTVTRGGEGTTAEAHGKTAPVLGVLTVDGLTNIINQVATSGQAALLPVVAGVAGETITLTSNVPRLVYSDIYNSRGGGSGKWYLVDPTAGDVANPVRVSPILAFCIVGATSGGTISVQYAGIVTGFTGLTAGEPVWSSITTPGAVQQAEPTLPVSGSQIAKVLIGAAIGTTGVFLSQPIEIVYVARKDGANAGDTVSVYHHPDSGALRRQVAAYLPADQAPTFVYNGVANDSTPSAGQISNVSGGGNFNISDTDANGLIATAVLEAGGSYVQIIHDGTNIISPSSGYMMAHVDHSGWHYIALSATPHNLTGLTGLSVVFTTSGYATPLLILPSIITGTPIGAGVQVSFDSATKTSFKVATGSTNIEVACEVQF